VAHSDDSMKIARVFPTKTSMSPQDQDAYFGLPELFMPEYGEIHISVVFTWDIEKAYWLKKQWEHIAPVKIGGVAIDGEGSTFIPNMYVRDGVTKTSVGCPNNCSWCFVKQPLKELEVNPGNNLIDNNLLACSGSHIEKVFQMLKGQKKIKFTGGFESSRITEKLAEQLRGLNIERMFFACDHKSSFPHLKKAISILSKYFKHRNYLGCYVLIGFKDDTVEKAEERLIEIYRLGFLPFGMLYRNKEGGFPEPYKEWRSLQHTWTRPAAINSFMKGK